MHLPDAGRAMPSSEGCATHAPSLLSLVAVRQTWRGVLLGHVDRDGGESRAAIPEWTSSQEGNELSSLSHCYVSLSQQLNIYPNYV